MIIITETLYKKMPDDIKACFNQLPNPSSEEVRGCFPDTKSGNLLPGHKRGDGTGNSLMGGGGSNCLQKPYNIHRNQLKTLAFYY